MVNFTHSKGFDVVHGDGVAKQVQQGILQHAAMAVSVLRVSFQLFQQRVFVDGLRAKVKYTYESTNRSLFGQLGFLGLKVMNLLKRT